MDKAYNHKQYEDKMYELWEKADAFTAPPAAEARKEERKPFAIIMPPPNANDSLHVGHAMFVSIEDMLVRYHRMKGDATLWLPGTDHAGIETQYLFEKKLNKKGKSRFSYDRETLYSMIWDYVQENSGTATNQMKKLGASADWSKQKFTLDEDVVDEVLTTFEQMHDDGLIYRDLRLVNYCTKCGTGFSELEVNKVDEIGKIWEVKYLLADQPNSQSADQPHIMVATTRPETLFGDVAVAVNPEDDRYQHLIGKKVILPFINREIPIIADEMVEMGFGTGMVKITPFHDHNDYEVWSRHKTELDTPRQVIEFNWKLNEDCGEFSGFNVEQGRKVLLKRLEEEELLVSTKNHQHSVGHCYRCSRIIEPLPLSQFFIKVKDMTENALVALDSDATKVHGAGHDKILRHWLKNLNDWNISRQIVWGIRMPIWYRVVNQLVSESVNQDILVGFLNKDGKFVQGVIGALLESYDFEEINKGLQTLNAPSGSDYLVSRTKPSEEGKWLQETDTFDTWFSSSQWPVVALGTLDLNEFEYYYPTTVMETAYDILMFWVMRMMMMGIYKTGKSPFSDVYLHGLVRDEKGAKMSKSKGNVINPLEFVDKYGADALRMALVMSTTAGHDSAVGESKVKGMRNFSNKIWNAARFVKMAGGESRIENRESSNVELKARLNSVTSRVTQMLEDLKIGLAAETVHNEFWHWYCDEVIEKYKANEVSIEELELGLRTFLYLLHPFMPFVTEAVWLEMGYDGLLIKQKWPVSSI